MAELAPDARRESPTPAMSETVGTSLGALAGLGGGITSLALEGDGIFHRHQIDVANDQLDTLGTEIAGLRQAEQTLTHAGQASTSAYRALEQRISTLQTRESTIERTTPVYKGGQIAEYATVGAPTLVGCLVLGAVFGNRIGHTIDRFRGRNNFTPVPANP